MDYQKEHLQFDCLKNVIKKKKKQKLKQVLFEMATNVNGETHICFNCEKARNKFHNFTLTQNTNLESLVQNRLS